MQTPRLFVNSYLHACNEGEWYKFPLPSTDYLLQGVTHSGGNGYVAIAFSYPLRKQVAIKRIRYEDRIPNEYKIQTSLHHPNIVGIYDLLKSDSRYYNIVMELGEYGDLHDYLNQQEAICVESVDRRIKFVSCLSKQLVEAISYLHTERAVAHGDIKVENILIATWKGDQRCHCCPHQMNASVKEYCTNLRFLLCDFGSASDLSIKTSSETYRYRGTISYISPEVLMNLHADCDGKNQDIWSLGCVIYELLADGNTPYTISQPVYREREETRLQRWSHFDPSHQLCRRFQKKKLLRLPDELLEFITNVMKVACSDRWKIEDCKYSRWNLRCVSLVQNKAQTPLLATSLSCSPLPHCSESLIPVHITPAPIKSITSR